MSEQNRIYQLTNEQLNVISADLLEAIVLISGKKDKTGLLDEINDINSNLSNYLSQNRVIVDDVSNLYQKVKADEKIKVKIKEVEINQAVVDDLIVKIKDMEKAIYTAENIALQYKNTADVVSKNIVVDSIKIDENLDKLVKKIDDDLKKIDDKDKKRDLKANEILKVLNEKEKTSKTFYFISTILMSISFFAIGFFTKYFLVLQGLEKNLTAFQFQTISNFIKPFF